MCLIPWRGLSRLFFVHLIAVEMRSGIVTHQAMRLNSIMLSVGKKAVADLGYHELRDMLRHSAFALCDLYPFAIRFRRA